MPKELLVYRGWIGAKETDYAELIHLGVQILGSWNPIGAFDVCSMTIYVHKHFVEKWQGRGVWGLTARKELVYLPGEVEEDVPF